ncbi:MAG: response regulator [Proteobacteria bacterium]|nr:MAG: response regulator [Pseudomonadota bacterium]
MDSNKLGQQKPLKILLAEDNKVNQILTLGLLRSLGYMADLAVDGKSAIEAVQSRDYDLVLMDCQLPVIDGYTAARHLKEDLHSRAIIVAYTAHGSPLEMSRCKDSGMELVLAKPISIETLVDLLNQIYERLGALPSNSKT